MYHFDLATKSHRFQGKPFLAFKVIVIQRNVQVFTRNRGKMNKLVRNVTGLIADKNPGNFRIVGYVLTFETNS